MYACLHIIFTRATSNSAKIFDCPKSDVEVIKGMKSRDKIVAVTGLEVKGSSDAVVVMKIQEKLKASIQ
jgi:uncharacterized protein YggU (UPF0235/DUF167 family)